VRRDRVKACGLAPWCLVLLCALVPAGPAAAQAQQVPVGVQRSERAIIPNLVELTGSVVSPRSARLSSDLGGLVQEVLVDLGDSVRAGAPLVQLDATLERLELRRAEAATREAREALADARREVEIAERLIRNRNMPQNELDSRVARARIAEAAVERLEAEEAHRRERVRRHAIVAPFDGVIAERVAQAGEWVAPGTAVVELVETDRLFIDVPVPERYFDDLRTAPRAQARLDAMPERSFPASVAARVPVTDPTARTFLLRLRPETGGVQIAPGMSARVTIDLAGRRQGVAVPRDAIVRYPDSRTTVWIVREGDSGSTVSERQVKLGKAFDGRVEVVEGLQAGVPVVVQGNEALREGQSVQVRAPKG